MSSRAEHYRRAEEHLAAADLPGGQDSTDRLIALAAVHAILACVPDVRDGNA